MTEHAYIPGGLKYKKRWGCSSRILKLTPKGDQSGRGSSCISSRATPSETLKAKNIGDFPQHPKRDQNMKFTPPKRDDEHPHLFYIRVPHPPWSIYVTMAFQALIFIFALHVLVRYCLLESQANVGLKEVELRVFFCRFLSLFNLIG